MYAFKTFKGPLLLTKWPFKIDYYLFSEAEMQFFKKLV